MLKNASNLAERNEQLRIAVEKVHAEMEDNRQKSQAESLAGAELDRMKRVVTRKKPAETQDYVSAPPLMRSP